ncbi:MAG TPA: hypothetical protein VGY30_07830 [Solirubrobacteraceae bacterium]|nr:hypothetical protein [Solirubrobacteraceae bacterium]
MTGPNTPAPEGKLQLFGYVGPEGSPVTGCKFVYGPEPGSYPSAAPCANHPGDEIQALGVAAIGGQFRLSFKGQETADLPYNATAAEVQSALRALPLIGATGVSVKRVVDIPDYHRYWVTFEGPLADTEAGELSGKSGTEPLIFGKEQSSSYALLVETLMPGGLGKPSEVTASLSGLTPGATYHYRLLAENGSGKTESPDAVFGAAEEPSTAPCPNQGALGVGQLPECRAWEMVSPPDKNGGDVLKYSDDTPIAADGSAASFASPSPFVDASGAGIDSEYESIRTAAGWQTHGIFPRQPPGTFEQAVEGLQPHYMGAFSSDLNKGIFFAVRPLDKSDPNVEAVVNLYLRNDLRTPGEGSYRLLTGCSLCAETGHPLNGYNGLQAPWVVAASSDYKHVIFESPLNLVKPANSAAAKLYESEEGTVRLVGILPNGTAASESTAAGPHTPNIDPLHVADTVSSDGSKIVWTDGTNVYLRVNHETTIQLNESELFPSEGNGTAHFQDATPNGSKVFFTDSTRLSEDAPKGGGLYVYDTTKPASDPHNLSFVAATSGPVLDISATGDTVYFEASNSRLWVWHNGEVRHIGSFRQAGETRSPVSVDGRLLFEDQVQPHLLQNQYPGYCPIRGLVPICTQFYTYDPVTEALQCVSCSPAGEGLQFATPEIEHSEVGGGANVNRNNHPISADGRHVFFATNVSLVPEDTNGVTDTYTFDTATSRVSLLSSGTDSSPSFFMEATPDGSNALFTTRQRLSGWDTDTNTDLYDARVNGGLPEPPPKTSPCQGEICALSALQSPIGESSASESFQGQGNPQPACPRGSHLAGSGAQAHCVKPKPLKRKHLKAKPHKKRRHHTKRGGHK